MPDSAPPSDETLFNATLISREDLTDDLAVMRVAPDGDVPVYKPGQYATLGLPAADQSLVENKKGLARFTLRPYSISSSPLDKEALEFYVAKVPDGAFTPSMWDLSLGDRLYMAPKCKGKFTLDDIPAGKDLVAVATGTGLAPFVSMLRTYRETGRWERFIVIHGTRLCNDLGYKQEFEALAEGDESILYIATCSREPDVVDGKGWLGLRGRVNTVLDEKTYADLVGRPLSPDQCHVLLCGNPAMIDDVTNQLVDRGFVPKSREHPDGNVHFEKYW
ncbi:MAG: ferredoxin--NADP reductase [Planctomycetota bacterium]